jgi:hypothetical protein
MADLDDLDCRAGVFDQVQYPVVALPDAILFFAGEFSEPGGRGVAAKPPILAARRLRSAFGVASNSLTAEALIRRL